jgi:hypothetical protein
MDGMPGNGGISRGRADAELIWGEETAGRTDDFEAKTLTGAKYEDPEQSKVIGVGASAPDVEARGEGAGTAGVTASTGSAAWHRRLSPHHRRAVGSFFARGEGEH